mgnify:CR=1 FL=1
MVEDLRSAVEELKKYENQIACTDTEVDSYAEVAGIYRYVGAGGTVKRPTKEDRRFFSAISKDFRTNRC